MDEEGKKINLGSFFERTDSIDKVASSALSKSNSAMNAVGANKLLIESLQMSIETMPVSYTHLTLPTIYSV